MSMVGFPLLLIPLAIYNIIVFLMPGVGFTEPLVRVPLVSGELWAVSLGDMLVGLGVVLVLLEVIKAARPGGKYLTDHLLSLLVFGAAAAEFVMWPKFANSTFFLLALLSMVDFFSGVGLRTKRRARAVVAAPTVIEPESELVPEHPPAPVVEPEPEGVVESQPEAVAEPEPVHVMPMPAPAPVAEITAVPAATSVAESVLLDHPGPKPAPPLTDVDEPPPKIEAPELQPEVITPASPETPDHPDHHETPKP
jgi:hypothetical protein